MGNGTLAFFLLYAFLLQFGLSSSLPDHLCPNDQALALLQFKHMFTINPDASSDCFLISPGVLVDYSYPKTHSWNRSTNCCSWDGVFCDKTTGQVIELNLTCSQLQGKFHPNSSLFNLSSLKRLELSFNDFSGSHISPQFGGFSSLMHLELSHSEFSGQIPSEISHLSKLRVLRILSTDLITSDLIISGPPNFKMLLENLTQLRVLDLSYVNISSPFPVNFSSYLTTLGLVDTQLYGILPERVFHLSKLESLNLQDNPQLIVRFPITKWNSSTSLTDLYLSNVSVTGKIPESFSYLTSLLYLYMSSCNLTGPTSKPLWNFTHIESLDLSNNHFQGPISQFFKFGKLKKLSLSGNNFSGQLEFLSLNRSWTQLEYLLISSNSLTGPIPSNVSWLQNLQCLFLSSNSLNGTIPSWIFSLPSLNGLDLSKNHLSGKILEFKSDILYSIVLSHNNLSGQIASSICNLEFLVVLDLGSNDFIGTIPQCLGEMRNVQVLDLSNNSLSGTINTTFTIGNYLSVINLHGNKLEGKVPRSLINCTYLELLDLYNNEFNDTFPIWLGTLPNLKILKLRSNKLHGPIKASSSENLFAQLRVIDLSSTRFSGNLPASLFKNFQAMKKNDENIGIPEYVGFQLGGYNDYVIITTKGLDLEYFKVLTTNIVIDFSRNEFEGYIPRTIGKLIGLRTLNLSHNGLEGPIPTSLQQLSVLESLDLSFNKIDGGIPQQLASLTKLEVLNLSHNHLVGCIPKGNQFYTFDNSSYQGNDGLRGFPLSRDCGGDGVAQAITLAVDDQGEEEEPSMISWQAVLMGYGCGLTIGLSIIYIMLSTLKPTWFARRFHELEHMIIMRIQRHLRRN